MARKSEVDPHEWSPRNPAPAAEIHQRLQELAPQISFDVEHTPDHDFRWDGDGPDPKEEGYQAYDVAVSAKAIVNGEVIESVEYLGGSYDKPDEQDPDIHGYLPQMLREAVVQLAKSLKGPLLKQAKAASAYLKSVLQLRYDRQMKARPE